LAKKEGFSPSNAPGGQIDYAPEFFRGGEVAGAGFVLKSFAEDDGALGHPRNIQITPQKRRYYPIQSIRLPSEKRILGHFR
jgi:hypothetical protein